MNYKLSQEELEFLKNLAKLAIASPAILNAMIEFLERMQTVGLPAVSISTDVECLELFSSIFLGSGEKISLIPAQHKDKPNFGPKDYSPKQTHVKDIFTAPSLKTASAFIKMFEKQEGRVRKIDQLKAVKGDGNLIVVGSPTSNIISRIALGYKEDEGGIHGCQYTPNDAFELKIRYALAKQEITGQEYSPHHYVNRDEPNGKEKPNTTPTSVLNWGIRKYDGEICLPETQNGFLTQDYLLISCLPNTFNKHSYQQGHRLLNIGGTHREGTLAAEKLFSNKAMLKKLSEYLKVDEGKKDDLKFWQALILVDSNPNTQEVTLNRIMECHPITVHEPAIEKIVQANHEALMRFGAES